MRGFTEPSPNQNPFVTVFAQKIDGIQSMPEARRQMLRAQAEQVVAAQIYPAWKKGVELLESQMPRATDEAGLWRFNERIKCLCVRASTVHDDELDGRADPPDRPA